MKKIFFVSLLIAIIFQSCLNVSNDKLCNLWYYNNKLGDYSEILFGKNNVALMMDETSKQVKVYKYALSNETVSFYPMGSDAVEFWVKIQYSSDDVMHMTNRAEDEFVLYKIDGYSGIELDTSKTAIMENFSSFKARKRPI